MAVIAVLGYVLVAPIILDAVNAELAQALALWGTAMGAGYFFGSASSHAGIGVHVVVSIFAGSASFVWTILYAQVLYSPPEMPLGVWLFRFGLAGALAFAGGAFVGSRAGMGLLVGILEFCSAVVGLVTATLPD
jgi:hypothetical protein